MKTIVAEITRTIKNSGIVRMGVEIVDPIFRIILNRIGDGIRAARLGISKGIQKVRICRRVLEWADGAMPVRYGVVCSLADEKVREKGLYPLDKQLRLKSYHGFSLCFHGR